MQLLKFGLFAAALLLVSAGAMEKQGVSASKVKDSMLIDDFSSVGGASYNNGKWRFFADTVMGGRSEGRATRVTLDNKKAMRLTGKVSLENNGGFIQSALSLTKDNKPLDASGYKGVRLVVRGNGERYAVHLRTSHTWLPWQYYGANFPTTGKWTTVEIPFSQFDAESLRRQLDTSRLTSIGIVAIKKAFDADVSVARVELYR